MERPEQCFDHPGLEVIADAETGRREQAQRDLVTHRGRVRGQRVQAALAFACFDAREMAVVVAGGGADGAQAQSFIVPNAPELLAHCASDGSLTTGDQLFELRAAHVRTSDGGSHGGVAGQSTMSPLSGPYGRSRTSSER